MQCEQFGVYLSKYVDDELGVEERKTVDEHLSGCSECRQLLAVFFGNDELLANALSGEIFGSQVVDSVMTEIHRSRGMGERFRKAGHRLWTGLVSHRARWAWAAAAALLVALTLIVVQQLPKIRLVDEQAAMIDTLKRELAERNAMVSLHQDERIRDLVEKTKELLGKYQIPEDPGIIAIVDPELTQIHCVDVLDNQGIVNFRLMKRINGRQELSDVIIRVGEPIGRPEPVSGYDFSTRYKLRQVGIADRVFIVNGKSISIPWKYADLVGPEGTQRIFLDEKKNVR